MILLPLFKSAFWDAERFPEFQVRALVRDAVGASKADVQPRRDVRGCQVLFVGHV
jgi:hypothetical protein